MPTRRFKIIFGLHWGITLYSYWAELVQRERQTLSDLFPNIVSLKRKKNNNNRQQSDIGRSNEEKSERIKNSNNYQQGDIGRSSEEQFVQQPGSAKPTE